MTNLNPCCKRAVLHCSTANKCYQMFQTRVGKFFHSQRMKEKRMLKLGTVHTCATLLDSPNFLQNKAMCSFTRIY